MYRNTIVAVVLLVVVMLGSFTTPVAAFQRPPSFTLDLDQPAAIRWNGAVKAVVDAHGWDNSFGAVYSAYGGALAYMEKLIPTLPSILGNHLQQNFPENYEEIQGIAGQFRAIGHPEINETLLTSLVYFYELAHTSELVKVLPESLYRACTGILSLPADKTKTILHGRNMDEHPPQGRNCTLNISVVKGGVPQFGMFDWMWITTGVYTASRVGGVTLELNWRNYGSESITEIISRIQSNATVPSLMAFRRIQMNKMDFADAKQYLHSSQFAAPFYVIMSGTGRRGAVLTIYFNSANNREIAIDDTTPFTYLVQTNYDHWLPDPSTDPRRTVAENALADLGRDRSGTHLGLWMTLSTYPVHNTHTMFTVLMSVDNSIDGYIRRAMVPA